MFDGFTKEDFQKAIAANPAAWGFGVSAEDAAKAERKAANEAHKARVAAKAAQPTTLTESAAAAPQLTNLQQFQSGVQSINEGYQQQLGQLASSGQYDRQSEILDAGSHFRVNAANEVEALMNELGLTQEDLKQSVKGSSNDLFMDLGVGNLALHDINDINLSTSAGAPNVRDVAAQGGPVNTTSDQLGGYTLEERVDKKIDEQALGLIAAAATGGVGLTTWSPAIAAAAKGAAISGGLNAAQGGDLESTLKAGAKGGATGLATLGLDKIPGLGTLRQADNFGGSFVSGSTNSLVSQAIATGEISLEDAAKAGLINMGVETAKDVYEDTVFTADGNLKVGVDSVNHKILGEGPNLKDWEYDIAKISNSTDLHGFLGENGALAKLTGLDIGRLPTTYLGKALKAIGLANRPEYDPDGMYAEDKARAEQSAENQYRATMDEANISVGSGEISENEWRSIERTAREAARVAGVEAQELFWQRTAPYQEEFFDVTTPRGESPITGAHTENPYGESSGLGLFSGSFGKQGTPAPISTGTSVFDNTLQFTPEDDPEFKAFMDRNPIASIDTSKTPISDEALLGKPPAAEITQEQQLADYWQENPQALEQAMRDNPEAWGMVSEDELLNGGIINDGGIIDSIEKEDIPFVEKEDIPFVEKEDIPFVEKVDLPSFERVAIPTFEKEEIPIVEKEEIPVSTSTPSGGGGSERESSDRRRKEAEEDDELFRLAKIVQVEGIPEDVREAVMGRIKGIIAGRGQRGSVAGDVTAARDRKSTTRVSREDIDKRPRRTVEDIEDDEIQKAIDEAGK